MRGNPSYALPDEQPHIGPLTPEVALFSLLLMAPALWNYLVLHALPLSLLVQRYLVVVLGCSIVATLLRSYADTAPPAARATENAEVAPPTTAAATLDVTPPESIEPLPEVPLLDFSDEDLDDDGLLDLS